MDIGKSLKGLKRERRAGDLLADPGRMELLNVGALRSHAAATALAAHQASRGDKSARLIEQSVVLRELARRTGDADTLAKAASAADRAAREGRGEPRRFAAARMQQALAALVTAEVFGDEPALDAASAWLGEAETALGCQPGRLNGPALIRIRIEARRAVFTRQREFAMSAASLFDEALADLEARVRLSGQGKLELAAARCERAELLIGAGARARQPGLLDRAAEDLREVTGSLDPDYLPLTWMRAETLRGEALLSLGHVAGEPRVLADAAAAFAAAADQAPSGHSPLDRVRAGHGLGLALKACAETTGQGKLFASALSAFDRSSDELGAGREGLPIRARLVHDRAMCLISAAERRPEPLALSRVEQKFRTDLESGSGKNDPVTWAVAQVALARIYELRAERQGDAGERADAAVALAEALEVFSERCLPALAERVRDALGRVKTKV